MSNVKTLNRKTMFDLDKWQEIFHTIGKNKLRTFLTAFSVAWGIFILIVLLGAGRGLRNGAEHQFLSDAVNTIWINGGTTTMPYQGLQAGREIILKNDDFDDVKNKIEGVDLISGSARERNQRILSYGKQHLSFTVRSAFADHKDLENAKLISGRFINDIDIAQNRKVCVIGYPVRDALFLKKTLLENLLMPRVFHLK
jgi:putative ABC transport system permease protein